MSGLTCMAITGNGAAGLAAVAGDRQRRSATAVAGDRQRRSATAVAGDRQRRYPAPSVTLRSLAMHLGPVYKGAQAHQLGRL